MGLHKLSYLSVTSGGGTISPFWEMHLLERSDDSYCRLGHQSAFPSTRPFVASRVFLLLP
jgi:hypothetical protein